MSHPEYKKFGTPITKLIEECAELQQALCKVERFGWFGSWQGITNFEQVKAEMDDVLEAMESVQEEMRTLKVDPELHTNVYSMLESEH